MVWQETWGVHSKLIIIIIFPKKRFHVMFKVSLLFLLAGERGFSVWRMEGKDRQHKVVYQTWLQSPSERSNFHLQLDRWMKMNLYSVPTFYNWRKTGIKKDCLLWSIGLVQLCFGLKAVQQSTVSYQSSSGHSFCRSFPSAALNSMSQSVDPVIMMDHFHLTLVYLREWEHTEKLKINVINRLTQKFFNFSCHQKI